MASGHPPQKIFEMLLGIVVIITLLCGGFAAMVFFSANGQLVEAQKDILDAALEGFKFGLAAILGLLGGRASS